MTLLMSTVPRLRESLKPPCAFDVIEVGVLGFLGDDVQRAARGASAGEG